MLKLLACGAACVLMLGVAAADPVITTFDYPDAIRTDVFAIDDDGTIVGTYYDKNDINHGFMRTPDGDFFPLGPAGSVYSTAISISAGAIVGEYFPDGLGPAHGFLRQADGTYINIDPPDAFWTSPIDVAGSWIAGSFVDKDKGLSHVFIRDPAGNFAILDPPPGQYNAIGVSGINNAGTATGSTIDNFQQHSYVRDASGTVTSFDPAQQHQSAAAGISTAGRIVGSTQGRAFIRRANGTFLRIDIPKGATYPNAISRNGHWIAGIYIGEGPNGFLRNREGKITMFEVPDARSTSPVDVNNSGVVAGWYYDQSGRSHGFVRTR